MPNWCEGTLKVRGEKENIKKFLTEALEPIHPAIIQILRPDVEAPKVSIEEDESEFIIGSSGDQGFHIKGTRRNLIESNSITYEFDRNILFIEDFKAAWGIEAGPLAEVSKKYQLDFRIYAFEKGMEFNQELEIHKGEVIINNEIKFDDYDWECVNPTLGG